MSLYFVHPWALLGLAGLALVWLWHRHSIALHDSWRRGLSLICRVSVFFLVVLALSDPRWIGASGDHHVVWLADVSQSVGAKGLERAREFIAQANEAEKIPSQSMVVFAARAEAVPDTQPLAKFEPKTLGEDATDLANALQFADASFPLGHTRTAVVFTDGDETQGSAADRIAALRARGVRVHTIPVMPLDKPEVLVRSVRAPRQVAEDEPFRLQAEIVSNRAVTADIDLFRNGARVGTKSVKLEAGVNRFDTTQTVSGDNVNDFAVAVRAPEDTLADNNQLSTIVKGSGKSKALMISDKPEHSRFLALALRQEGVVLDVRPPAGAPLDLADIQNYDLVMIDNVPATDLSARQMDLLATFVRDFGGGLLMLGGDKSFGLGGYYQTSVEEILPVRCDFERERETPSLALVLVIDKSGSMNGEKIEMAKDAAKAAVDILSPQDFVGVVGFDGEAFWISELGAASDKYSAQQKISTMMPGGGTNIAPGLEVAYAALSASPAKLKHVILLTDGVSTPGPFYELTTQMAQDRITVSTVAVGADADQRLLEQIAVWGNGRYYYTDSPQTIPQIFTRETMTASKSALQELPFQPKIAKPGEFLAGLDFSQAPYLLGYVMTKPKPLTELWLMTERGEPLLATWRYGLGQTGAFTSDARARWAVEWLKWDGFGRFWAQIVRRLKRAGSLKTFPVLIEREAGGFRISVDAIDEKGQFRSELAGDVVVAGPDGFQKRVPLSLSAPGRLEAWFPADKRGSYHAQVLLSRNGQPVERQYVSATLGYPDEFLLRPVNTELLEKLSAGTGGSLNPSPGQILTGAPRSAPLEREMWPYLLALALLIFMADVASRRWPETLAFANAQRPR
jgi:uncharacterized membrane protein/uncharacterized protein YegL